MKESHQRAPARTLRLGRRAGERSAAELPGVRLAVAGGTGVIAAMFAPWSIGPWTAAAIAAAALALAVPWRRVQTGATLLAVGAAMAAWYVAWISAHRADDIAHFAADQWHPVVLRGVVASSPECRPNALAALRRENDQPPVQSLLDLEVRHLRSADHWIPVSGTVSAVVAGDVRERLLGDQVIVYGHLQRIAGPTNPGSADMREVHRARGIRARLRVDAQSQFVLERPGPWGPGRVISWISVNGERTLNRYVGEEAGPLAAALVLGRRRAVDPELRDRLVETGTVHLLSVSGLHLGMVAAVVTWLMLLSGWSRGWQVACVVGVCVFYAALTGARPPVLRASMLVAAVMVGTWAGKQPSALNSLGLAAVALMIVNPTNLLQAGTQLSFIAVVTLVVAGREAVTRLHQDDPLDTLLQASRPWAIRQGVTQWRRTGQFAFVSFWVWAATAPLVWQSYHVVAPVSVLANVLMILPLTTALIAGLLTTAVGLLLGPLAWPLATPLGWTCRGCIELMRTIVDLGVNVPLGHFWLPSPPLWWVAAFYAVIAVAPFLPSRFAIPRHQRGRWLVGWMIVWTLLAIPLATRRNTPSDTLAVTFVDVGHGTSALIELPDGDVWLYDAGRLGDPAWSASPIQDVLWSRGIWRLDGILVSHADADHYNAIPGLLDHFSVGSIVTPPGLLADRQRGLDPLRQTLQGSRVRVVELSEGASLRTSSGRVWGSILHPPETRIEGSDNVNSMVLRIDHHGTTLLLPGDLEIPGGERLLHHGRPAPGGVLMAPHHGSLQQDARPLLDWMRPSTVVISGGKRAERALVRRMWSQGGADVRITAAEGALRVEIDAEGQTRCFAWREKGWR